MKRVFITIAATLFVILLGGYFCIASGVYDVAADRPHAAWMQALLNELRVRSIERRADDIQVPRLDDAARIIEGAEHYAAMCTGCHLAPGMLDTEIRQGLLPKPPDLSREKVDPAQAFWVIKHGIQASAMPAWGKSHDDEEIWNLVAFVQQLATISPEQYRAATASSETKRLNAAEDHHEHDHDYEHPHGHDSRKHDED